MPTKSATKVTQTAVKTTTPKTTRRRRSAKAKVTTTKAKVAPKTETIAPKVVAKVTQTVSPKLTTKTMIEKPNVELISLKQYREDVNKRWQIHLYEIQELNKDLKKGYDLVVKHGSQFVNYAKESYKKQFNV
tara:strand:+ start:146 stop:541 length:396 start_codon:yes stop_codon:yes gene_type:complete